MKKFAKIALGAVMLAGAATAMASAPAEARGVVGVGIGAPGYYGGYYGPGYGYTCDPYSRWYGPYGCGYAAAYYCGDDGYGYGPSFSLVWGVFVGRGFHGVGFHGSGGF